MKFMDWMHVYGRLASNQSVICPKCKTETVEYRIAAYEETRMGFGMIWCSNCKEGIWLCRIEVPRNLDFISIDDSTDEMFRVDGLKLITPP